MPAHLVVKRPTSVVLTRGRIRLNELVVEKNRGLRNEVEEGASIWQIWDLEEFLDEEFCVIYAASEAVRMNLLQLVHKNPTLAELEDGQFKIYRLSGWALKQNGLRTNSSLKLEQAIEKTEKGVFWAGIAFGLLNMGSSFIMIRSPTFK